MIHLWRWLIERQPLKNLGVLAEIPEIFNLGTIWEHLYINGTLKWYIKPSPMTPVMIRRSKIWKETLQRFSIPYLVRNYKPLKIFVPFVIRSWQKVRWCVIYLVVISIMWVALMLGCGSVPLAHWTIARFSQAKMWGLTWGFMEIRWKDLSWSIWGFASKHVSKTRWWCFRIWRNLLKAMILKVWLEKTWIYRGIFDIKLFIQWEYPVIQSLQEQNVVISYCSWLYPIFKILFGKIIMTYDLCQVWPFPPRIPVTIWVRNYLLFLVVTVSGKPRLRHISRLIPRYQVRHGCHVGAIFPAGHLFLFSTKAVGGGFARSGAAPGELRWCCWVVSSGPFFCRR